MTISTSIKRLEWYPPLLARVSMASIFVPAGWGKLHDLARVTEFFTELGIPLPEFHATLVGTTEFSCGLLILFGLATRLASLPLIATMAVAILTAKREEISSLTDLFGLSESVYIVVFTWLLISGPGVFSLDTLICGNRLRSLKERERPAIKNH